MPVVLKLIKIIASLLTAFVKFCKHFFILLTQNFLFLPGLVSLNSTNSCKSHTSFHPTYELQLAHQHIPCQLGSASSVFSHTSCSIDNMPGLLLRDVTTDQAEKKKKKPKWLWWPLYRAFISLHTADEWNMSATQPAKVWYVNIKSVIIYPVYSITWKQNKKSIENGDKLL